MSKVLLPRQSNLIRPRLVSERVVHGSHRSTAKDAGGLGLFTEALTRWGRTLDGSHRSRSLSFDGEELWTTQIEEEIGRWVTQRQ